MTCHRCGKPFTQWAHRIPQTKRNIRVYGEQVIHHRLNLAPACSLECNSAASISNHPEEQRELLAMIYEDLLAELQ
jgi:hypothetical protein